MFTFLFERESTINRHISAPLLAERQKYLELLKERGVSRDTLRKISACLLRIVEFLNMDSNHNKLSVQCVRDAAERWLCFQHKNKFTKEKRKSIFFQLAIRWLTTLDRLKQPREAKNSLFCKIYKNPIALKRHCSNYLLSERIKYLKYWYDNGAIKTTLQFKAQYLLITMKYLNFYQPRMVTLTEVENAANHWAREKKSKYYMKNGFLKSAKRNFIQEAVSWLKMINCLKKPTIKSLPFEKYLNFYIEYIRQEKGLSENTIKLFSLHIRQFLIDISNDIALFKNINPLIIDKVLEKKSNLYNWKRNTIQSYGSSIRSFLKFAETQRWCRKNLADSIKIPRAYKYESLPYFVGWDDVKKILADTKSNNPSEIRNRAILMLLSIYGMRCSEVAKLKLSDIDWKNECFYLIRAKSSSPQVFPLIRSVGDAILRYIKDVRQNDSSLREVFLTRRAPHRCLSHCAIYEFVSKKIKKLNLNIKHYGSHALRHACATHLINEGISLKEISDLLGHKNLDTTRIYAKVDLINLRKIAEFDMRKLF